MFDEVAQDVFDNPNFAHLATVMRDGSPHIVPVWIARDGERIVLVKEEGSVGLRNVVRDPRVSISVVDRANPYRRVHVRGQASAVERGEPAVDWLHRLSLRYMGREHPEPLPAIAPVIVEPSRVSSLQIQGYN
jgi:PPOX class probable F420-dependent enzyme